MPSGKQTRCAAAGHAGAYQPDHHVLSRTCTGAEPPGETVWSDGRQRQSRPATRDARGNETMRGLTERQRKVLEWMKMYVRKHGRAPTRTEISDAFGWADATAARSHLEALEKKGYIEILKDKYRGIRVFEAELPLVRALGEVAAGTPIVAEERIIQRVPAVIAEQFRPKPDYLLKVVGDSMDATGLCDGDVVAVLKTETAESGKVVVARFGDEVTLKRLVRIDERHIELRPESHNTAHKVMKLDLAKHIVAIDGVVVGALIGELRDGRKRGRKRDPATPRRMLPKTDI